MKKEVKDTTAQLKKYEEVDLYKNLETIKNRISKYNLKNLKAMYDMLPLDFRGEIFGKKEELGFVKILGNLKEVKNLDLEKVNNSGDEFIEQIIEILDRLFSEKNRNNLGQVLTNLNNELEKNLKIRNKKKELKKKFEDKKMEIENASFFHIPGKNIIESCNFEF